MLARCPSCRNTFSTDRAGRQNCPVCGKPLVVPEQAGVPPAPPPGEAPVADESGTPWERREELGFVAAWTQTVQGALFEPGRLFRSARLDRGPAQLGFALLTSSVFWALGQLLERLLLAGQMRRLIESMSGSQLPPVARRLLETQALSSPGAVIAFTLFTPVVSFLLIYLNAAVTHGFALLLGQAKRGFAATFAACAYASAPLVLLAVPGCGSIIATVWLIVLTGIGLKETHRISTGGAAASVLAPYLLFCCLGSVGLAMILSRALGQH